MVFHWSLSDSKSPQVSRTLLSIIAVLHNGVVWVVFTRPPPSKSSSPFNNPLVTVPKAPITIGIIVTFMFQSFFQFPSKVEVSDSKPTRVFRTLLGILVDLNSCVVETVLIFLQICSCFIPISKSFWRVRSAFTLLGVIELPIQHFPFTSKVQFFFAIGWMINYFLLVHQIWISGLDWMIQ